MNAIDRSATRLRFFWAAISVAGRSTRPEDVDDVVAFVSSFGDRGVETFWRELELFHSICDTGGITSHTASLLASVLGRAASGDELRAAIEGGAVYGLSYFESTLDDVSSTTVVAPLEVTLQHSLRLRRASATADERVIRPMSRVAPLRRNGSPWLSTFVGFGIGVRSNVEWPFRTMHFMSRLEKQAATCSQQRHWLALRERGQFREVDIVIEFWRDPSMVDSPRADRVSASRIRVFLPRHCPTGNEGDDGEGIAAGDAEARSIMEDVEALVAGLTNA